MFTMGNSEEEGIDYDEFLNLEEKSRDSITD
jgi:hypothetical protein